MNLQAISAALGCQIVSHEQLAGGDISGATKLSLSDGRRVVAKSGPLVTIEARMLQAMRASGASVPEVLALGPEWLVMEFVAPLPSHDEWSALAETLQALHQPAANEYGWDEDYAFGPVTIENARCKSWPEFWAKRRILCHRPYVDGALAARLEQLSKALPDMLPSRPAAVLLHGDLWGGNIIQSGGRAWLIDPACYHGHREVDLAMLTVFSRPPKRFFDALEPEKGWRDRLAIYRLWPWLVHLRLFGGSYRAPVERELAALGF